MSALPTKRPLMPVAEAAERLFGLVEPVGLETVGLDSAVGRILRSDMRAARTQPPFAASAMDGYAVRRAEAAPGARLRVAQEIPAGSALPAPLAPGETMRIFTGAPVPEGADAIALQEDVDAEDGAQGTLAVIREPLEAESYIRPAGGDFKEGETLATAPRILSPEDVALAAAAGLPWLDVSRRPRAVLISIGDELRLPGQSLAPGQIVASNAYGVGALLEQAGATVERLPIVEDDLAALTACVEAARGTDLIVTLGGASDGDHDHARAAFRAAGAALDFYKIAMRPGKPLAAGKLGRSLILGLPGNPVSAMVCARLFAVPAVAAMQGMAAELPRRIEATLGAPLGKNGPREHYERATLTFSAEGARVVAARSQDSSLVSVLSSADVLIVRPPHDPPQDAGRQVECVPLRPWTGPNIGTVWR